MSDLISRQAAIEALERIFDRCEEIEAHLPEGDPDRVGYKMYPDWLTVWKYLHQLPSAQPEQSIAQERYEDLCEYFKDCSDQGRSILTDRKEFKSWLDRMKWHVIECDKLGRELEKLKSAQPKTGKWEAVKRSDGVSIDFRCSACHRFRFHNGELRRYKYCPECGCRMLKEGE